MYMYIHICVELCFIHLYSLNNINMGNHICFVQIFPNLFDAQETIATDPGQEEPSMPTGASSPSA